MEIQLIVLLSVIGWVAVSIPLFRIAQLLKAENAWFAFVPFLHLMLMSGIGRGERRPNVRWGLLWVAASMIPVGGFVVYPALWGGIAEEVGESQVLGWVVVVPLLGLVGPWIMAMRLRRRYRAA